MALTYHRDLTAGLEGKYLRVVQRLAGASRSILELGCHTGYLTRALLAAGHQVVGIEKDPEAAGLAAAAGLPVVCADITSPDVFVGIPGPFDAILLMDILEHLGRPEDVLERLKPLLAENGRLLVTGPNVAYWAVRAGLALGRWNYRESGILDRTHQRFYTIATWESLLGSAGYQVTIAEPAEAMVPLESVLLQIGVNGRHIESIRNAAVHLAPTLFTTVYFLEATR